MSRDMTRLRGWCAVSGHRNNMPLDASFFPNGDIATVTLGDDYALLSHRSPNRCSTQAGSGLRADNSAVSSTDMASGLDCAFPLERGGSVFPWLMTPCVKEKPVLLRRKVNSWTEWWPSG